MPGVVLFPDATLPLRVIEPRLIAAVERAMTQTDSCYTIAVVLHVSLPVYNSFSIFVPLSSVRLHLTNLEILCENYKCRFVLCGNQ